MRTWLRREPALILGLINAALALILTLATDLDAEQIGATLVLTSALVAVLTRQVVYAPATVDRLTGKTPAPGP